MLPAEGFYKLNVDAGFCSDSGTGSTGTVLRDDRGTFQAGSCSGIPFVEDASSAEARGLGDGLILANEVGLEKFVVKSDCMDVIDIMLNDGNSLGPTAAIYEECSFLAKNFSLIQFAMLKPL
ncbi:retrotransposon expressed [Hordeum vulgare]|nr:retrotransposon expressed [Hordeum vulgare]